MIQRIQSVYLLVAVVLVAALFTLGHPFESEAADSFTWFAPAFTLLAVAVIVLAGVSLVQYRNRATQARTAMAAFGTAEGLGLLQALGYGLAGELTSLATLGMIALALPFVASVFLLMARQAIRKDIALVRSMDRLR